jgi:hypothetical protein
VRAAARAQPWDPFAPAARAGLDPAADSDFRPGRVQPRRTGTARQLASPCGPNPQRVKATAARLLPSAEPGIVRAARLGRQTRKFICAPTTPARRRLAARARRRALRCQAGASHGHASPGTPGKARNLNTATRTARRVTAGVPEVGFVPTVWEGLVVQGQRPPFGEFGCRSTRAREGPDAPSHPGVFNDWRPRAARACSLPRSPWRQIRISSRRCGAQTRVGAKRRCRSFHTSSCSLPLTERSAAALCE